MLAGGLTGTFHVWTPESTLVDGTYNLEIDHGSDPPNYSIQFTISGGMLSSSSASSATSASMTSTVASVTTTSTSTASNASNSSSVSKTASSTTKPSKSSYIDLSQKILTINRLIKHCFIHCYNLSTSCKQCRPVCVTVRLRPHVLRCYRSAELSSGMMLQMLCTWVGLCQRHLYFHVHKLARQGFYPYI